MFEQLLFSMVDLKGKFFTKVNSDSNDDFPTLRHLAAKVVFYINNNMIMNLEKTRNQGFFCECYKYSGCEKENGELGYCTLCTLDSSYFSYLAFPNKNIDFHIRLCIKLIEDFQQNKNLEIFTGDYTSKSMNFQEGTISIWSLYKYVFKSNYLRNGTFK